jgi:hypothetical protein
MRNEDEGVEEKRMKKEVEMGKCIWGKRKNALC